MFFWTTIKKNRTKYSQTRGFSEEQVREIIFNDIVLNKDVRTAQKRLLELPGLKRFFGTLKTEKEREDFKKHMQKYICIWLPDCPFEVSTTNRYTITNHEASTTARRRIGRGDTIKYLCGNLVAMTPEEEKELDLNRRDFSVVKQVRKKQSSLFLGPARFANHDCKANAKLCQQGNEGMTIVAMREIGTGEEITVDYGDHYFGHNNRDCLCVTCEGRVRNGWAPENNNNDEDSNKPSDGSSSSSRTSSQQSQSRKRPRDADDTLLVPTEPESNQPRKQPRLNNGRVKTIGLHTPPESTEKSSPQSEAELYGLSGDGSEMEEDTALERGKEDLLSNIRKTISPHSFYGPGRPTYASGLVSKRPVESMSLGYQTGDGIQRQVDLWLGSNKPQRENKTHTSYWVTPNRHSFDHGPQPEQSVVPGDRVKVEYHDVSGPISGRRCGPMSPSSTLSSMLPEFDFQDSGRGWDDEDVRPRRGRPSKPFNQLSPSTKAKYERLGVNGHSHAFAHRVTTSLRHVVSQGQLAGPGFFDDETEEESEDEPQERIPRKPGDYTRTRALLAVPNSRWTDCLTCNSTWVQSSKDTRRECPRCERHSIVYGFQWPKTDSKPGDTEVRIFDHRLVNRFLSANEKKALGGRRGRGLTKPADGEGSIDFSEESEVDDDGTRKLRSTQARSEGKPGQPSGVDLKQLENSNEKIVKGKGWFMIVDQKD